MEIATSAGPERPVVDAEAALRFLTEASAVLAASLDYEDTVRRVADLLVPKIADWCGIDIVEEGGETRQITTGIDDPELESFLMDMRRRYRQQPNQSQGTRAALEENRSVLVRDASGEALIEMPESERELYRRLNAQSYIIVPLLARGRTLGAVTLLSRQAERRYGAVDLAFAEHLGRRFAL